MGQSAIYSPRHIFISYSHYDSEAMVTICAQLQSAGLDTWTDTHLEPGTPSWKEAIAEAIEQAGAMVVLLSPRAKVSKWVNEELGYAETHNVRVFPVLIEGDQSNAVPFGLINAQRIDVRNEASLVREIKELSRAISQYDASQSALRSVPLTSAAIVEDVSLNPRHQISLKRIWRSSEFLTFEGQLKVGFGVDESNQTFVSSITTMKHLLIAGRTGSGKSICIHNILCTLVYHKAPRHVRLVLLSTKPDLALYEGIPHLLAPIVKDYEKHIGVFKWVAREMDDRIREFAIHNVRNIDEYNRSVKSDASEYTPMPHIVVCADEILDIMLLAPDQVEGTLLYLTLKAATTGIHLIVSTNQVDPSRIPPSLIKSFPARILFAMSPGVDGTSIFMVPTKERVRSPGEMILQATPTSRAIKLQGPNVPTSIINHVTDIARKRY